MAPRAIADSWDNEDRSGMMGFLVGLALCGVIAISFGLNAWFGEGVAWTFGGFGFMTVASLLYRKFYVAPKGLVGEEYE